MMPVAADWPSTSPRSETTPAPAARQVGTPGAACATARPSSTKRSPRAPAAKIRAPLGRVTRRHAWANARAAFSGSSPAKLKLWAAVICSSQMVRSFAPSKHFLFWLGMSEVRTLRMHSYGGSDIGRRRQVNEDAYLCDDEIGLWIVADGMGGHAAGEVASQEAIDTVHGMVKRGKT